MDVSSVEYPLSEVDLTDVLVATNAPGTLIDRLMSLGVDRFDSHDDVLGRLSNPATRRSTMPIIIGGRP